MARVWEVETGLAVAVMRGCAQATRSAAAFQPDRRVHPGTDSFDSIRANVAGHSRQPLMQFLAADDADNHTDIVNQSRLEAAGELPGPAPYDSGVGLPWAAHYCTVLHGRTGKTNRVEFGPDSTSQNANGQGNDGTGADLLVRKPAAPCSRN